MPTQQPDLYSSKEEKANAHLIAAAPDLLDALKGIYEYMEEVGYVCECNGNDCLMCVAKKAISKAEGKV